MSKPESEYLFVEVAAQRCLQLMRGARPKIETDARKYSTLAIDEVEAGVVPWRLGEDESVEVAAGSDGDGEEE
jgi:DNA-directed RNA polymerase subunit K/omega